MTSSASVVPSSDQLREYLNRKMQESGEKERLKDELRAKLVECGWKDKMKKSCKDKIGDKGVNNVTVESLSADLVASARKEVPPEIKADLLLSIRKFLSSVRMSEAEK